MTYFLTILLWASIIYGAYFVIISLMTIACCYTLLCISHSRENFKELVKELLYEVKHNHIWFRFFWINWYGPRAVFWATRIVIRRAYPNTPFDGLTSSQINEVVSQIRFATDNGCPQDLPAEIREWGFEDNVVDKVIDWTMGGRGENDLPPPPAEIKLGA